MICRRKIHIFSHYRLQGVNVSVVAKMRHQTYLQKGCVIVIGITKGLIKRESVELLRRRFDVESFSLKALFLLMLLFTTVR